MACGLSTACTAMQQLGGACLARRRFVAWLPASVVRTRRCTKGVRTANHQQRQRGGLRAYSGHGRGLTTSHSSSARRSVAEDILGIHQLWNQGESPVVIIDGLRDGSALCALCDPGGSAHGHDREQPVLKPRRFPAGAHQQRFRRARQDPVRTHSSVESCPPLPG